MRKDYKKKNIIDFTEDIEQIDVTKEGEINNYL